MYWWQNLKPLRRLGMKGQTIVKFTGEGCQARDEFNWVGKIIGFEKEEMKNCEYIIIEIIKHNFSYGDNRDRTEKEFYRYPLVNADIQNVNGVWILFT